MCTHIIKALDTSHGLKSKPKEKKDDEYIDNEAISIDKF